MQHGSHEPTILAFDTSSRQCVVGVVSGRRALSLRVDESPGAPSEGLLPMIHACLDEARLGLADLDAVAVGRGPGSFTGTRIALSTAKGLALGSGIRVLAVSSLEAAALDAAREGPVAVALDARKGEVLVAAYLCAEDSTVSTLIEPRLLAPAAALEAAAGLGPVLVRGDAAASYPAVFVAGRGLEIAPRDEPLIRDPSSLARLALPRLARGEVDDPDLLEPVYSRPPPVHEGRPGGR